MVRQWAIIICILGFSALVVPLLSSAQIILLIGAILAVVPIRMLPAHPGMVFIALMGTLLIPYNGPSGVNLTMGLVAGMLGIWLLRMLLENGQIEMVSSLPVRPMLLFVLVAIIAYGIGQIRWYAFADQAPQGAQLGTLALYVLSVGTFLVVANQIHDIKLLEKLVWVFFAVHIFNLVARLVPGIKQILLPFIAQSGGSLFWTWGIALAAGQAIFNRSLRLRWRLLLALLILLILYVLYFLVKEKR
ncbi:hypothetical protein KFU94_07275 [Chloroflexi bacterium TSY]|nr:hypothetical protein [Chloroflexi bacterium TSY]